MHSASNCALRLTFPSRQTEPITLEPTAAGTRPDSEVVLVQTPRCARQASVTSAPHRRRPPP